MCTGNCDRSIVVTHDLSEKLGSCQHRETFFLRAGEFRVVRMDGSCINNNLNRIGNIGSALTIVDLCTFAFQKTGQGAFLGVRTGNCETLFQKYFSKSAHTDTANTDKMDRERFMEVYLIHNIISLSLIFLL